MNILDVITPAEEITSGLSTEALIAIGVGVLAVIVVVVLLLKKGKNKK